MFLSDSIRNLVNSIRASRRDRKGFVDGLRQNNLAMKEENDRYMKNLHESNNARKQELWAFLAQAKEQREMNAKETKASIKQSLDNVHQAVESIKQSTNEFSREMREDIALSRKYWSMLYSDEPLPDPNAPAPVPKDAKDTTNKPQSEASGKQEMAKETAGPVETQKQATENASPPKESASKPPQPIPGGSAKNMPSPKAKKTIRKKKNPTDSAIVTPATSSSKEKKTEKNKLLEPLDGGKCTDCDAYLAQNDKSCLNCGKQVSKKKA
jgi:hypothetical protein